MFIQHCKPLLTLHTNNESRTENHKRKNFSEKPQFSHFYSLEYPVEWGFKKVTFWPGARSPSPELSETLEGLIQLLLCADFTPLCG